MSCFSQDFMDMLVIKNSASFFQVGASQVPQIPGRRLGPIPTHRCVQNLDGNRYFYISDGS